MNDKLKKLVLVFFLMFWIAGFTNVSFAGGYPALEGKVKALLADYTTKAAKNHKSTKTQNGVLLSCESELKEVGYQLSSLIVAPIGGGAGVDARSWTPGQMTEVCTLEEISPGTEIQICLRISN